MVAEVCSCYVMRAGEVLELFATEGLRPEAVHRTRLRVGEGLVGVIAATAQPAGARRRAVPSRFRLPAGDRRGDLSLADGRADPARRPRARRAGGAEPHPAQLYRGRDRGAADHRHGAGRARRQRRAGESDRAGSRPTASACCRCGSTASSSMPASPSASRCCTSRASSSARWSPRIRQAELGAAARGGRRDAERDRRSARPERHRRRRRASRHPRDLPHVRRRSRLAAAHDRRGAQRAHRRGGGAEGAGRDARAHEQGERSLSARAARRSRGSHQPAAAASRRPRISPPTPSCRRNSSSSRAAWGRPSCWITTGGASRAWCWRRARPPRMSPSWRARSTFPSSAASRTCWRRSRPATSSSSTPTSSRSSCGRARTSSRRWRRGSSCGSASA